MDGRPKLAKDHLLGAAAEFDRLAREELDKARDALRAPFVAGTACADPRADIETPCSLPAYFAAE